ncbi:hypothetical protein HN587_07565 [Candidatus Woesearchaeota archaeon]|jgi:hypothetical protein|nr:hypothetical protein [Candidatus Woesearchaeota archaeon]
MTYLSNRVSSGGYCGGCSKTCSPCKSTQTNLETAISSSYANPTNTPISHSISAQKSLDTLTYSNNSSNSSGYFISLDARPEFIQPRIGYAVSNQTQTPHNSYQQNQEQEITQSPQLTYSKGPTTTILKSNRPTTQFIDSSKEVKPLIEETFELLTNQKLPTNIEINICTIEEFKKAHKSFGGKWTPGIQGFAINNYPKTSKIFVLQNHLDSLMLTLGHEIGHVLTTPLDNLHDEEAKAFAFEIAWVKTIIEHDVGDLTQCFNPEFKPANNGLHNIAFNFVVNCVKKGESAITIYEKLKEKVLTVLNLDLTLKTS